jgi:biotin transport system substrate-specific component
LLIVVREFAAQHRGPASRPKGPTVAISVPAYGPTRTFAGSRPVLADRLPKGLVADAVVVIGVAALMSLVAQLSFKLPNNPVPVTGQTFGVLLSAAAVGPVRGLGGQLLYVLLGWIGLPVFAHGTHGWTVIHGATGGYFVGFLLATLLIGWQARHGIDRRIDTLAGSFLLGTALIYVPAVWWLAHLYHWSYTEAIAKGAAPFILGDLLKALAAGALIPAAWKLVGDRKKSW